MNESGGPATERQVLYAMVSTGFVVTVTVLIVSAALAGLVPTWWTVAASVGTASVVGLLVLRWKDTRTVLTVSVLLLVFWMVGTLLVSCQVYPASTPCRIVDDRPPRCRSVRRRRGGWKAVAGCPSSPAASVRSSLE